MTVRMIRKVSLIAGEYYHIYSRGVNKSVIYKNHTDYIRFIFLLYAANSFEPVRIREWQGPSLPDIKRGETLVDIGAFCLMPNHFHILIKEKIDGGITKFMKKLMTGYSMYVNKRYDRTGTLFESRFKARHVDNDEYLKYLFAYIHLNPVKLIEPEWKEVGIKDLEAAKTYLKEYSYSSYFEYLGRDREEKEILKKDVFPGYFKEQKDFEIFLHDWLDYKDIEI